jgi:hypothetical protein
MNLHDVCIVIPTKRSPPLKTLESYRNQFPKDVSIFLIVDPSLLDEHKRWLDQKGWRYPGTLTLVKGKSGLVPQVRFCYTIARKHGYKYFFRLDDDCAPNFFVRKDRSNPPLRSVIRWARQCIDVTETSLVGFANTSRVDWLGRGYARSYALVHGGAQMVKAVHPDKVLPEEIVCYEDIYRSCAHRQIDGAVGRVQFVGMNKIDGMKDTVNRAGKSKWKIGMKQLMRDFPGFGEFYGEADEKGIPKFRHKRHDGYRNTPPEK